MLNFIFFGRLTKEKWFDLILYILDKYKNNKYINFYIFWKWDLEKNLKKINAKNIKYLWWQNIETINKYLEKSHYTLMPSKFLETFGLSALESINKWVPVIWYWKWWLKQFITQELDIIKQIWKNDEEKIENIINKLIKEIENQKNNWAYRSKKAIEKSNNYKKEKWLGEFENIIWKNKKILLISDYIENIWWIESYIINTKKLLNNSWHEVDSFWLGGKIVKYRKILMSLVWFNIFAYWNLKKKIKQFEPDIIWLHSVSRYLWFLPLLNCKWKKTLIMYHDLWYFHPFPSKVYEEEQIIWKVNLKNFIKMWKSKNPIVIFAIFLKLINLKLINFVLNKKCNFFIIPSEFMTKYLQNWYWIKKEKIKILKHFAK